MTFTHNSTWYKPPTLHTRLNDMEITRREHYFHDWWKLTHTEPYDYKTAEQPELTKCIIRDEKVIGVKEGKPLKIRHVPPSAGSLKKYFKTVEEANNKGGMRYGKGAASAMYLVIFGGKRLDGFLSSKRATEYAKAFLNA